MNSSCTSSATIAREQALHFWPERPKAERATPSAAAARSALAVTIAGFLPPISVSAGRAKGPSCMRRAMSRPTSAEPVKATPATADSARACPVPGPPCTRLNTPSPSSASRISPSSAPVQGASSDGLSTTVLPAISAAPAMFTARATGKLKGAITAKAP